MHEYRSAGSARLRRLAASLLGAAVALGSAAGCGSSDPDQAATNAGTRTPSETPSDGVPERADADLVIWSSEDSVDVLTTIAEEFAEANDISVAVQGVAGDRLTSFLTANAAANGPDVLVGPHDWIGAMVQNGAISPLRLTENDQRRYSPVALEGVRYSDTLYGLPYAYEAVGLFRNTDLVPTAPTTVEELAALAAQAGTADSLCLPIGKDGDAYSLHPLYSSAGGYLFGRTPDGGYSATDLGVGRTGSLQAAMKFAELGEAGVLKTSITEDNAVAKFISGDCPFLQSGPWALDDLRAADVPYAVTPMVGFAGMEPASPLTTVRALYVASKGPSADLARRFVLDAVNSPRAMRALYDDEHRPPAMTQVLDQVQAQDPDIQVFADAAGAGDPLPSLPQLGQVWQPLGAAEAAIIDGADPTSTMMSAGAAIAEELR